MRILAGDIGGTKTLLRCVEADGRICAERRFDSGAWTTFDEVLRAFMAQSGAVDAACLAVAGPVFGGRAEVTNVGWRLDAQDLQRDFRIGRVVLVNDFYAVAVGVPRLGAGDLVSLQAGNRDSTAPIAVLGAGTGLGEAIVTWDGGRHRVIATEGGHADFAPQDEEQARLFVHLHRTYGHVSWERVASGIGLVNIFTFLGGEEEIDGGAIAERAAAGDPRAVRAFEIFVDAYGAEAGNLALKTLARGGVFLAGGIGAKNLHRFTDGRFVEAFCRKGRFRPLMETIPVDLIVNQEVGLIGAAAIARG